MHRVHPFFRPRVGLGYRTVSIHPCQQLVTQKTVAHRHYTAHTASRNRMLAAVGAGVVGGLGLWLLSRNNSAEAAQQKTPKRVSGLGVRQVGELDEGPYVQMTPKEVEVLKEQFLAFAKSTNADGNPEMTEADFWEWVNQHSTLDPQQQTREFLSVLFHLADHNKNAKISFEEFLLFVCSQLLSTNF